MFSTPRLRRRLASLAIALAFSGQALAIGLGAADGQAILGQPLRIRVALIGATDGPLDASCFRLRAPQAPTDADYILRDGLLRVESVQGRTHLIVASPRSWRQPVVEFRILASCGGAEVARDYVLLASLPPPPQAEARETRQARVGAVAAAPSAQSSQSAQSSNSALPAAAAASGETLVLAGDSNLNALARDRYPHQRETRDEYRRLMAASNPDLFGNKGPVGSVPLPAGTVLNIPPDLPKPDASKPAATELADKSAAQLPPKAPAAPDGTAQATRKVPDRLVIGGGSAAAFKPMSPRELAAAVDRLERMVEDQGRIHLGMSDSLKNVEIAFGDIRGNLLAIDARMNALEIERIKAETAQAQAMARLAEQSARFGLLEMLALVLASGAMGAGLIHYFHRLQLRRQSGGPAFAPHGFAESAAVAPPPQPLASAFDGLVTPAVVDAADTPAQTSARVVTAPVTAAQPTAATRPAPIAAPAAAVAPKMPPNPSIPATMPPVVPVVPVVPVSAVASAAPAVVVAPVQPVPPPASVPLPAVASPASDGGEKRDKAVAVEVVPPPMIEFTLEELPPSVVAAKASVAARAAAAVPPAPTFSAGAAPPPDALQLPSASDLLVPGASDPTLELAELMESMGLASGAAQALVEHIRGNPAESVQHWLKLLDLYQRSELQDEFSESVHELKSKFNVAIDDWSGAAGGGASLADYPHLAKELTAVWGTDGCGSFLLNLIADTREGTRAGFPRTVVEDILLLRAMLDGGVVEMAAEGTMT
ncbi:MAG: hypothetical protein KJ787_14120 [Gammaproteobacteria bacterium]|nr:hypothetical protein [Gammaproteobacteria bacterium]MBU1647464.1 hypothetical protein [Gammaproteobacteria bacterium]MBU1972913.1 hypothetical protein [Gammaproteobacteria bacterium]